MTKKPRRLYKADVKEMSVVARPANKRKFLVVKSEGKELQAPDMAALVASLQAQPVSKFAKIDAAIAARVRVKKDDQDLGQGELVDNQDPNAGFSPEAAVQLQAAARIFANLPPDVTLDDIMEAARIAGIEEQPRQDDGALDPDAEQLDPEADLEAGDGADDVDDQDDGDDEDDGWDDDLEGEDADDADLPEPDAEDAAEADGEPDMDELDAAMEDEPQDEDEEEEEDDDLPRRFGKSVQPSFAELERMVLGKAVGGDDEEWSAQDDANAQGSAPVDQQADADQGGEGGEQDQAAGEAELPEEDAEPTDGQQAVDKSEGHVDELSFEEFADQILRKAEGGKGGEGSRGGKVIGHTKSGRPIYESSGRERTSADDKKSTDAFERGNKAGETNKVSDHDKAADAHDKAADHAAKIGDLKTAQNHEDEAHSHRQTAAAIRSEAHEASKEKRRDQARSAKDKEAMRGAADAAKQGAQNKAKDQSRKAGELTKDAFKHDTKELHSIALLSHKKAADAAKAAGDKAGHERHMQNARIHAMALKVAKSKLPGKDDVASAHGQFDSVAKSAEDEPAGATPAETTAKGESMATEAQYRELILKAQKAHQEELQAVQKAADDKIAQLTTIVQAGEHARVLKSTQEEVVRDLPNLTGNPDELAVIIKSVRETEGTKEHADKLLEILKAANSQLQQSAERSGSMFQAMGSSGSAPAGGGNAEAQIEALVDQFVAKGEMSGKSRQQVYRHVITKTPEGARLHHQSLTEKGCL